MIRLWLVRHGATSWSEDGRLCGWGDVPLSEAGRQQADRLAGRLAGREFDGIWSSDLSRAVETAEIAVGGATADGRLRELDFGGLEGMTWEDCEESTREALLAFDGFHAPGGESVTGLCRRVMEFVRQIGEGDHLVFTHGGVIRLMLRTHGDDRQVTPGELVVQEWAGPDLEERLES